MTAVRVVLPGHLRTLARVGSEVTLDVTGAPPTIASVLDAVETTFPMLGGTIRDRGTGKRRDFVRFYVCNEDWSHHPPQTPLPEEVLAGKEPFLVVGAMAGG